MSHQDVFQTLRQGAVIPALPLALTSERRLDERRQRALCRYYASAGAGGIAAGVHTTQFTIRDPRHGLFRPVLELVAEEMDRADRLQNTPLIRIGGVCGRTDQAVSEAAILAELGYHAAMLSLSAWKESNDDARLEHCRRIAEILPIVGFYLQVSVGGPVLSYDFWRGLCELPNLVAIKIAPFNRYRTIDVARAVAESGRDDVALYTGNDDHILLDLLTPFRFQVGGRQVERRVVGGLLGQWAVWTSRAVELHRRCRQIADAGQGIPSELLSLDAALTDANAALFDAANDFTGCIAGIHEVLRRQGLLEGIWCLDPEETLSPGQLQEIDRVCLAYPALQDNEFVGQHKDQWLSG